MKFGRSNVRKVFIYSLLVLIVLSIVIFIKIILSLPRLPENLNEIALSNPTEIYSDSGELVTVLSNRQVVKLDQVADEFQKAIIAMEDAEFRSHHGLNKKGIIRAMLSNLRHLRIVAGGSSITQQLAKNLFFSFERVWGRKLKEMLVAMQMERRYSKNDILESYCNQIYFGSNAYGIELAAQTYFAKHADELTLAEAAFLANLPNWPSQYNPYKNYDLVKQRQRIVLNRMVQEGFISQEEMEKAYADSLNLDRLNQYFGKTSYYVDYIKRIVEDMYSRQILYYGGLKIHTSLDTRLQSAAFEAVKRGLEELDQRMGFDDYDLASTEEKKKYAQAALVAIDPRNGKVKALVGGRDFAVSPYNRATESNRQVGSAFKPFTYVTAIDKFNYTPATVVVDTPITFEYDNQTWSPENFENTHAGPMTLKTALTYSVNVVAARVIYDIGPENVVDYAHRLGIESELEPLLSLALGSQGVSPLEIAKAYCSFANGGITREPQILKSIENAERERLMEFTGTARRAVDAQSIYVLVDMMKSVVNQGTARRVRGLGFDRPCAGKTGTTNDARDAWFIGFT
ncbi:PBP1A family penicillin-binding protein, partial [candidate division KSB1 bacterium]|nr:PBP1A family penicillin-binding protein [candidate division KSB1 bacterium]